MAADTANTAAKSTKSKANGATAKLKYLNKIELVTPNTDALTPAADTAGKTLICKPNWIRHYDKSAAHIQHTVPIYCLDLHSSGTRCATGGADCAVKVWDMSYVVDAAHTSARPKMLCQLTHHTAAVNALKFSHNGTMLATCSDGSKGRGVIVYELSSKPAEKQLGSDYVPHENWVIKYSIAAHTLDILDVAYSADDALLATCSVDNTVAVFNTSNGALIRHWRAHNDWVKGLAFDPLNRYLASQSSDCLAIWSLADYTLCKQLERSTDTDTADNKAAATRYKNTSISRISFSPDGAIVTATSCHINNKACSKLYSRQCWLGTPEPPVLWSGCSEATTVTRFSPCMYRTASSGDKENVDYFGLCAQGSKDRLITIWRTGASKPVVVCERFFSDAVHDIAWSADGTMLLACSKDGTVCCMKFSAADLPGTPISQSEMQRLLKQAGVATANTQSSAVLTPALLKLQQQSKQQQQQQNKALFTQATPAAATQPTNGVATHTNGTAAAPKPAAPLPKQVEVREPGNKRRIAPVHVPDAETTNNVANATQNHVVVTQTAALLQSDSADTVYSSTQSATVDVQASTSAAPAATAPATLPALDTSMSAEDSASVTTLQPIVKSKRDASGTPAQPSPKRVKTVTVQNGANGANANTQQPAAAKTNKAVPKQRYAIELPNTATKFTCSVPSIQHTINNTVKAPVVEISVNANNKPQHIDSKHESVVLYTLNGTVEWNDTLYMRATHICATVDCVAVAGYEGDRGSERGVMYVYTHAGRRLMPCVMLSAPVTHAHSSMHYFIIVTADAQLHTYTSAPVKLLEKYTFAHLLHKQSQLTAVRLIKDRAQVILSFTNNVSYVYHSELQQFVRIVDGTNYLSEFHNVFDSNRTNAALLHTADPNNLTALSHTINYIENQLYMSQYLNNADDLRTWAKLYVDKLLSVLPQQKQYFNAALHNKYLNKIGDYCATMLQDKQLHAFVQSDILVQLSTHTATQTLATNLLQQINSASSNSMHVSSSNY